ncbi:MAG: two-component system, sensor histidine kinase and response regulator [Thermodesulfobacteriota bacterium]|nr:two-component system, sensor histidine kinase and response regulator [Thermodesulfobacteriota bacterium]
MNPSSDRHTHLSFKSLLFVLLAMVLIQTQPNSTFGASDPPIRPAPSGLPLTAEESAWLAEHSEITIATNQAWPPMDYIDADGTPQGIGEERDDEEEDPDR